MTPDAEYTRDTQQSEGLSETAEDMRLLSLSRKSQHVQAPSGKRVRHNWNEPNVQASLWSRTVKCGEINSRITEMLSLHALKIIQYMVTEHRHKSGWVQELPSWSEMMDLERVWPPPCFHGHDCAYILKRNLADQWSRCHQNLFLRGGNLFCHHLSE